MEQGQEQGQRSSDGWDAVREGRSNGGGWPLGLNINAARLSRASASSTNFLISTPSSSSSSSSGFDTESTGSFFPEKSTTLGSLIGIQTSSQLQEDIDSMEGEKMRRKGTGGNNRSRAWWSLLGCGSGLRNDASDISPSLAHLLDRERRESLSLRQTADNGVEHIHEEQGQGHEQEHIHEEQGQGQGHEQEQDERFHSDEIVSHRSSCHDSAATIPSRPCGPTLRLILQQPSPTYYLSTDWNVFSDLSQNHHIRGHSSPGPGCLHTFWPSLCGRLSPGVAN